MLFKILVILDTLGATVWTGGSLMLAVLVLAQALKNRTPDCVHHFEIGFYSQLHSQILNNSRYSGGNRQL